MSKPAGQQKPSLGDTEEGGSRRPHFFIPPQTLLLTFLRDQIQTWVNQGQTSRYSLQQHSSQGRSMQVLHRQEEGQEPGCLLTPLKAECTKSPWPISSGEAARFLKTIRGSWCLWLALGYCGTCIVIFFQKKKASQS